MYYAETALTVRERFFTIVSLFSQRGEAPRAGVIFSTCRERNNCASDATCLLRRHLSKHGRAARYRSPTLRHETSSGDWGWSGGGWIDATKSSNFSIPTGQRGWLGRSQVVHRHATRRIRASSARVRIDRAPHLSVRRRWDFSRFFGQVVRRRTRWSKART